MDLKVRSLFKLSLHDLRARPLLSAPGLCTRSPQEVSWQDLSTRSPEELSLHRSLEEVSWQDLWPRYLYEISRQDLFTRSPYKLSIKALWQDVCKRPFGKISATALHAMSPYKVSRRGVLTRSLYKSSIRGLGLLARSLQGASWQDLNKCLCNTGFFKKNSHPVKLIAKKLACPLSPNSMLLHRFASKGLQKKQPFRFGCRHALGNNIDQGGASNNKQMCHRMYRDLRARQTWMQVVKGIRCRDVNKETCP